jgi:hypothetical protein
MTNRVVSVLPLASEVMLQYFLGDTKNNEEHVNDMA